MEKTGFADRLNLKILIITWQKNMGCIFRFLLLVTFFSITEVSVLLWVASNTSLLFTIFCCAFTGIVGGLLVRQQGLITLARIKQSLSQGEVPADEAIGALMLLIVGVLLCVPGFITDTIGFIVIIPAFRKLFANVLLEQIKANMKNGNINVFESGVKFSNTDFKPESDFNQVENAQIIEETAQGEADDTKKQI